MLDIRERAFRCSGCICPDVIQAIDIVFIVVNITAKACFWIRNTSWHSDEKVAFLNANQYNCSLLKAFDGGGNEFR